MGRANIFRPMADSQSRTGTTYGNPEVLTYLAQLHVPHDAALEAAFTAPTRFGMPAVQVGPSEGALLGLLVRMIQAKKVVEFGALAGYSGIHLARALAPGGRLISLEIDAKHADVARQNFAAAGLSDRTEVRVGPALSLLELLEKEAPFDAVFIDADKGNYDQYGRWAAKNLRAGGLLLGDNAFYFGKLLDAGDPAAAAMRRFHEEARLHFDTVCIPTPDGLLLGLRR